MAIRARCAGIHALCTIELAVHSYRQRKSYSHGRQLAAHCCELIEQERALEEHVASGILGMTEPELYGYLNDLLHEEAEEAAAASGKSAVEELRTAGFAAAEAASTYAIKLILANNAFLTRQLLDLGVLESTEEDAE
jgi:hypothetical protein